MIASDAGGKLLVQRRLRGGGLIRTALRSSDILMDRVWQLEKEIVGAAPGFLFAPITQSVEPGDDPHARRRSYSSKSATCGPTSTISTTRRFDPWRYTATAWPVMRVARDPICLPTFRTGRRGTPCRRASRW